MAVRAASKIEQVLLDSHLALIKNSVGSRMFRTLIARVNGKRQDILRKGDLSCAFFASSVLAIPRLIRSAHLTVDGTIKDMRQHGWRRIRRVRLGAVLVWEKQNGHKHIGFYVGNRRAVSTSSTKRIVHRHHWTFDGKRKIIGMYWHKKFSKGR